jgi:hypothetical protein
MFRYAYLHQLKTNDDEYYIFSVIFWSMLHVALFTFQNKRDVIHYEKLIYCTPAYTRLKYSYTI